jgi:hypothetical protein
MDAMDGFFTSIDEKTGLLHQWEAKREEERQTKAASRERNAAGKETV